MDSQPDRARILFVDDEESIRVTLPRILERYGYETLVASSVAEALVEINCSRFDVLITDLNIHKEGDGFLVVSAMRHVQPDCVNLILTGYPGFESALRAIQTQVDDYFIKPADIDALVTKMKEKLDHRHPLNPAPLKRLSTILTECSRQITEHIVAMMNADPRISAVNLSEEERVDHLPKILKALIEQLELESDEVSLEARRFAAEHGRRRKKDGYDAPMLVRDFQLIAEAIHELMRSDLLPMGLVGLTIDLGRLTKGLDTLLLESVGAFESAK